MLFLTTNYFFKMQKFIFFFIFFLIFEEEKKDNYLKTFLNAYCFVPNLFREYLANKYSPKLLP